MPKRATPSRKQKDVFRKRQTPSEKRLDLIKQYRQRMAIGAKCYAQADDLLNELLAKLKPGKRVKIGDGLWAVVIDRFADSNKVWQPVGVRRFELQLQDAAGQPVRMRDRKRNRA